MHTLKAVIAHKTLGKNQTDPIEIIPVFEEWENKQPTVFESRLDLNLTSEERKLKDTAVNKKFITYMSMLRSSNAILRLIWVFCHMSSKDGCPLPLKKYNDHIFEKQSMDD